MDDWSEEKYQDYDANYHEQWLQDDNSIVLSKFFNINPLGVEICPGVIPPKKAWDALVLYLASKHDELSWQIGATVNRYPKKYHSDISRWFANLLNLSHWTIEQWAYIERNVSYEARTINLSIWFHRPVAKIKDSDKQAAYLDICTDNKLSISQFEKWLETQGVEIEEQHYQSDRDFENEQAVYQATTEAADSKAQVRELQAKVEELENKLKYGDNSKTEPEEYTESLTNLSDEDVGQVIRVANLVKAHGFSAVTIFANGDVQWKR